VLVEHCRIPQLTESFYAITQARQFPHALLGELLRRYTAAETGPVAA
jgi:LysR family transcriptional activator of nhaA